LIVTVFIVFEDFREAAVVVLGRESRIAMGSGAPSKTGERRVEMKSDFALRCVCLWIGKMGESLLGDRSDAKGVGDKLFIFGVEEDSECEY